MAKVSASYYLDIFILRSPTSYLQHALFSVCFSGKFDSLNLAILPVNLSYQAAKMFLNGSDVPQLAGFIVPYIIAVIAVTLRLLARRIANIRFWWDDWLAVCSLVCF